MKLLVIVLCLYSEYALIHRFSAKRYGHIINYLAKMHGFMGTRYPDAPMWLKMLVMILPAVAVYAILNGLFGGFFYGLVGFIIHLVVFYYALGPNNPFFPVYEEGQLNEGNYFVQMNRSLFAVITIYIILGPVGLIVYRLIDLSREYSDVAPLARRLLTWFEYIPIRVTACFYLLVGNFQHGLKPFIHGLFSRPEMNEEYLKTISAASFRANKKEIAVADAEEITIHALIVYLVFYAVVTIVAWL